MQLPCKRRLPSQWIFFIIEHFISSYCKITVNYNKSEHKQKRYKDISKTTFNPLMICVPHRVETSQLIYIANQLTGFYIMRNIGRWWVKKH